MTDPRALPRQWHKGDPEPPEDVTYLADEQGTTWRRAYRDWTGQSTWTNGYEDIADVAYPNWSRLLEICKVLTETEDTDDECE